MDPLNLIKLYIGYERQTRRHFKNHRKTQNAAFVSDTAFPYTTYVKSNKTSYK